jgi:hypothetical protein
LLLSLAAVHTDLECQVVVPDSVPANACWRVAFAPWTPPLNWSKAGHAGDSARVAGSSVRLRDSIYARDSSAAHASTMWWERTSKGLLLQLLPAWWPAGVSVVFDSASADSKELFGTAVAFVSNAASEPSRARARVLRVACGR